MQSYRRLKQCTLGSLFFLALPLKATVPGSITYQGSLKQSGVPVNVTGANMQFRLYNVPTGGSFKWSTSQIVDIKEGLYRAELTPDPNLVDWNSGDFYIETCLGTTCFSPREKLTSVPTALMAKNLGAGAVAKGDVSVEGSLSITGAGKAIKNQDGTAAAPTFTFSSDPDTGLFHQAPGKNAFASNGFESVRFGSPTSADGVLHNLVTFFYGGASSSLLGQTTTGVTTAGSYVAAVTDGLLLVNGNDGANFFRDILACGYNSPCTVINSSTSSGFPPARTYASDGNGIKLTMASGSYKVNALVIDLGRR